MSRRLSDYDDYQFDRGLGHSDEECERVEDFSQASGWRCVDHGACREKGKVCSYNPMYQACDCKEEEKDPVPGDWRQAGNLYYPQWLELFDSRERWWAIEEGLRPKPGAAWGSVGEWGFQPRHDERTNQWIKGWFQATSPRERIRFFDKDGALPDYLKEYYVELMRMWRAWGSFPSWIQSDGDASKLGITQKEANYIISRADGGQRQRITPRLYQNNRYEHSSRRLTTSQCPFCGA